MKHGTVSPEHPRLRVREVIIETDDAHSIVLEVPAALKEQFVYRPGQFLTFRIPSDLTGSVARSYSLSSTPGIDEHLKITVKRTPDGYGSHWMCENVQVGDDLTVLPPSGVFTPQSLDDDFILFAAGSGITPIISILKSALQFGTGRVRLVYANRSADAVIFDNELRDLVAAHGERLDLRHWFDAEQGFLNTDRIVEFTAAMASATAFMCGPAPFMNIVAEGLASAAFSRDRVHREVFLSYTNDPFVMAKPVADSGINDEGNSECGDNAQATVHIDGATHEISWPRSCSLIDALLSRSIDVPYSCRSGECGSCAANIVSGEVNMLNSEILDPQDIADGYILGCQSRPVSDVIEIQF